MQWLHKFHYIMLFLYYLVADSNVQFPNIDVSFSVCRYMRYIEEVHSVADYCSIRTSKSSFQFTVFSMFCWL